MSKIIVADNGTGVVTSCGAISWFLSKSSRVESYFTAKADFTALRQAKLNARV